MNEKEKETMEEIADIKKMVQDLFKVAIKLRADFAVFEDMVYDEHGVWDGPLSFFLTDEELKEIEIHLRNAGTGIFLIKGSFREINDLLRRKEVEE